MASLFAGIPEVDAAHIAIGMATGASTRAGDRCASERWRRVYVTAGLLPVVDATRFGFRCRRRYSGSSTCRATWHLVLGASVADSAQCPCLFHSSALQSP